MQWRRLMYASAGAQEGENSPMVKTEPSPHRSPHHPGPPSRRRDAGQGEDSAMETPISVPLPSYVSGQSPARQCPPAPLGGCFSQGPSLFYSVNLLILIPLCFFLACVVPGNHLIAQIFLSLFTKYSLHCSSTLLCYS